MRYLSVSPSKRPRLGVGCGSYAVHVPERSSCLDQDLLALALVSSAAENKNEDSREYAKAIRVACTPTGTGMEVAAQKIGQGGRQRAARRGEIDVTPQPRVTGAHNARDEPERDWRRCGCLLGSARTSNLPNFSVISWPTSLSVD